MEYNKIAFLVMIFLFVSYLSFITLKFGVLSSISESFYKLGKYNRLFVWWLSLIAVGIMSICNTTLITIAGTGLLFVIAAPYFKTNIQKYIHYTGAGIGVLFTQIYLGLNLSWVYNAMFVLGTIHFVKCKNHLFWIETLAFSLFFIGCGVLIF